MWISYVFKVDFLQQKNLVRMLKPMIKGFEEEGLIENFNYNHYWSWPPTPDDHLAVRLNLVSLEAKKRVEDELRSMGLRWEE
jgi:hypothetical protein